MPNILIVTTITSNTVIPPGGYKYPRIFGMTDFQSEFREVRINANRETLKTRIAHEFPFLDIVILMDSDVVTDNDTLDYLVSQVSEGRTPCVYTKGDKATRDSNDHVCAALCAVTMKDYINVDYMQNAGGCQCSKLPNPYYIDGNAYEMRTNTLFKR